MLPATTIPRADTTSAWLRNLEALNETQPESAEELRAVKWPCGVLRTTGRDGAPTFRITDESGQTRWFGDSSMPTISAVESLAGLAGADGNVALPGILTGVEPFVVLDRLPKWAAVFVVEEDPKQVRLAFELRDFSAAIRGRRFILLLGSDPVAATEKLFTRNPGFLMPATLLTVPQRSAARIAELQKSMEAAARVAASVQGSVTARALERLQTQYANRPAIDAPRNSRPLRSREADDPVAAIARSLPDPAASDPMKIAPARIALVSSDVGAETLALAGRMERAAGRIACACVTCVPDRPDRCHLTARIQAVASAIPDAVFLLNGHPRNLRPLLPETLPIVSVFTGDSPLGSAPRPDPTGFDHLILPGKDDRSFVSGAPEENSRVFLESLAADDSPASSPPDSTPLTDRRTRRSLPGRSSGDTPSRASGSPSDVSVAIVGHLPDARPESLDITLHSHLALWDALSRVIRTQIDQLMSSVPVGDDRLDALLASAERHCGMYLKDAGLRGQFIALVGGCLMPAIRGVALAETAVAAGCSVLLHGTNWPEVTGTLDRASLVFDARQVDCRAAVFLDLKPASVQFALDGMYTGCLVIPAGSVNEFERKYPYLADLTPCLQFVSTRGELLRILRGLRENDPKISAVAAEGRDRVRSGHTMSHRLREWLSKCRPQDA